MKYSWENSQDIAQLNPEPTDAQRATYRHHQKAGTSPGNPKWYKPINRKSFVFQAGLPPKYLRLPTGAQWNAMNNSNSVSKGHDLITKYKDGSQSVRKI